MTRMPLGLQWKHFQIYKQQIPDDSHVLFSIWFYLIPVDFMLIHFNQCQWTTACRDNAISTLHMYILLWYGCTGTCSGVRQSTRLHKLKYRVKIEWNHFKKDLRWNLKMHTTGQLQQWLLRSVNKPEHRMAYALEKPGSWRLGCLVRLILTSAQSPYLNRTISSARRRGRRKQNLVTLRSGLSGVKDMLV